MKQYKITFQPGDHEVYVEAGATIKDAINIAGIDFDFPCGGEGKCGKCRVKVVDLSEPLTTTENEHLQKKEIERGVRLACMKEIEQDLIVQLPYEKSPQLKILTSTGEMNVKLEPCMRKNYVELNPPTIEDQAPDAERLTGSIAQDKQKQQDLKIPLEILRKLPKFIREENYKMTIVRDDRQILNLEKFDTTKNLLGMAFDIGTTTIVGYLMDLYSGKELSVVSALNPQTKYGADVVSRIAFVDRDETGLAKLHDEVVDTLNELVIQATDKAGVAREDVYSVSVVGNTCMHHLFLGIDPTNIAVSPYVPVVKRPITVAARELGIAINEAGMIYMLPNIAGFVGADTVGVILATEMDRSNDIKLAIDIGTNGEIVLGSKDKLMACSTAAGSAFEGAQIECGMRGTWGAIDHVNFKNEVEYSVIGAEKPLGICGSGLIDAVAGMLTKGIIDEQGLFLSLHDLSTSEAEKFRNNIIKHEGENAFLFVNEQLTSHGRPIFITQSDIGELQLAKGAIAAGIKVLMEAYGVQETDISEVLLAGAFGNYLNPHSACAMGLIPVKLERKVKMVGNAAGMGAIIALLSCSEYRHAAEIADFVKYVELTAYPDFDSLFIDSLSFSRLEP